MNSKTMAKIAMIAAVYTVVSLVLAPFSFGAIQVRISESLTLLPIIYQPSIYGLTLGCFLTNLLGALLGVNPTGLIDAVVGTAATLGAALLTYKLRNNTVKGIPVWSILMPVLFNGVIVGAELGILFFPESVLSGSVICGLEVAAGELISVIVGWLLLKPLKNTKIFSE